MGGYFADRDVYCPFCGERFDCACEPRECEGHPAGPFDPMGQTVYCDGSCNPEPDSEPDYGGAFDGFTVSSDADPGL